MFSSKFLTLPETSRRIFFLHSTPKVDEFLTPIVAIHGLGSASTFWVPALKISGLCERRAIYAYDFDGHGLSDFSGRADLTIDDLVTDLKDILEVLHLDRVVLLVHSMNGMVGSGFSERFPELVETIILLSPIRNISPTTRSSMLVRAEAASTIEGLGEIANTVASSAVSKICAASDLTTTALIRVLVSSTKPAAYAAACRAVASAPVVHDELTDVRVHFIGGDEDYLAPPHTITAWAKEVEGTHTILSEVGHWGALESPHLVGKEIAQILAPSVHHLFLAEFRSPNIYTLGFDVVTQKLSVLHTTPTSDGGHSWLDVSPSKTTLYTTVWSEPPTVSSYRINPSSRDRPYPTVVPSRTVTSTFLSGYVSSTARVMYSACGPQVDVFELDDDGALRDQGAVQSYKLREDGEQPKEGSQMDFGGLRHGGHSCDLSPDGTKLYVADIGHNCVWMFHVDRQTGLLKLASKNIAHRSHDGPRHTWPHPNGRLVYSLQEHSSYIDVLQVSANGDTLDWVEGVNILPEGADCNLYWADEVRLSPTREILFGSTRGLDSDTKGYVTAWGIDKDGRLTEQRGKVQDTSLHRLATRTSGGWANAIAVCPDLGPHGEVYLTLTDSEEGSVQILAYGRETGFVVLDQLNLTTNRGDGGGASVTVWM